MAYSLKRKIRQLSLSWHRDLGYLIAPLIVIYSISGIALNHIDDWDPDFIIQKKKIEVSKDLKKSDINDKMIHFFSNKVGEDEYKVYDFPTENRVKIYYDNASLQIDLRTGEGQYERITKKHFIYESNLLHKNSVVGWRWVADIFALILIIISITGLIILKGKYGFKRRGIWLTIAGFVVPIVGILFFYLV